MTEIHSGWMTKQGGLIKNWKKRWFVLRSTGALDYYLDKAFEFFFLSLFFLFN